jgi:hypothetical protein
MPALPEQRLAATVIAAVIAVLVIAGMAGLPASAATVSQDPQEPVAQHERFQAPQVRMLPPFGARNVLAPVEIRKRQPLTGAQAER